MVDMNKLLTFKHLDVLKAFLVSFSNFDPYLTT